MKSEDRRVRRQFLLSWSSYVNVLNEVHDARDEFCSYALLPSARDLTLTDAVWSCRNGGTVYRTCARTAF